MEFKECRCKKHEGDKLVPVSMFGKSKNYGDGLTATCKQCLKAERIARWDNNPELAKQKLRDHYAKHREHRIVLNKASYEKQSTTEMFLRSRMLQNARNRANAKQLEFSIDINDIIIPKFCPVFNIELIASKRVATDQSPTLDRIDSTKGYIKGNVHVISKRANTIKNSGTPEEHKLIYEFFANFNQ